MSLTNFKSGMICVKLIEIMEWMPIQFWYIDNIVMLTFIPYDLLVLWKIESTDLDGEGGIAGTMPVFGDINVIIYSNTLYVTGAR